MANQVHILLAILTICATLNGINGAAKPSQIDEVSAEVDGVTADLVTVSARGVDGVMVKFYFPKGFLVGLFLTMLQDVSESFQEKLAIETLFNSALIQFKDRMEEAGLIYVVAIINEIIEEVKLFSNVLTTFAEEATFAHLYFRTQLAKMAAAADRAYQLRLYRLDAQLVPRIRRLIFMLRRFIGIKLAHQRRLQFLLRRLHFIMRRNQAVDARILHQEAVAQFRSRLAVQRLIELSLINFLTREGLEDENAYERAKAFYEVRNLEATELFNGIEQALILGKMAKLHQKEVEAGVMIDILRRINFALVYDERYRIQRIRGYPRQLAEIRKLESQLYVFRRKLRHYLYLLAINNAVAAKKSYSLKVLAEEVALAEIVIFGWDYLVVRYVVPGITV
ncbi:uncharacterized protein TRIADDRAFT_59901 [Trichoplax adhaerens]|uniref:Uncharacterized protein n=1 Tax=Trichoplax adhaerens TaxID=10228 RepID=B3S6R7_TRIAD|nr:predicted protein [Trichoplax adhaerens]EDV21807.1 predicted protein [Trichoplax adhaerens]|eukprot:XP_002115955.1 predicted protein [Trichoplax adhaerens]